jgi:protein SCO1/2
MKATPIRALAAGAVAAALAIAILIAVFAHRDFPHRAHYAGTPLDPPKLASDAILIDQTGHAQHLIDPAFAATFVFFGYTHCPDECPLALATLGRAYRALDPAARQRTRVVFVTVDPAQDTPAVLGRYVANFDPHFVALTDSRATLAKVWQAYGVEIQPQAKELIGHGDAIYAIDASGHIVLIYPPDVKASDLEHDASALAS